MTELQYILLFLIKFIEILPFVLFINCILRAMPRHKQQSYDHPDQMTIFDIQPPETTTEINILQVATCSNTAYPLIPDPWLLPLDVLVFLKQLQQSPHQPIPKLLLLPAAKKQLDYSTLNSVTLRSLCSEKGIKWRGVRGGKHLTKQQMIEQLGNAIA